MPIKKTFKETDGDTLDIDFSPSNYTPSTTPAEASDVDDLTAHLAGIDDALSNGGSWAILQDQKSSGTDGGTASSGSWDTRDLNTEEYDGIGITISSNQFTLPAGDYLVEWWTPGYKVDDFRSALYNESDSSFEAYSQSAYGDASVNVQTLAHGLCKMSIGSSKTFSIRQKNQSGKNANGLGRAEGFCVEIYTVIKILKLS